jgi:chromosome segregation protein
MLRLEKLELRGFKSFCDYTEIRFDQGITAVVGPNGCGKSNVLDSIAWVLGEQSARSLRGGKMDDVIFNGTRLRKPVGLAEVTLTLIAVKDIAFAAPEMDSTTDLTADDLANVAMEELALAAAENVAAAWESATGWEETPTTSTSQLAILATTAPTIGETTVALNPVVTSDSLELADPKLLVNNADFHKANIDTNQDPKNSTGSDVKDGTKGDDRAKRNAASKKRPRKPLALPTLLAGERVTIARRLYRSGESDYLMNGHSCRLRDIQDFFAGTGLGGAQYAIIEQGHIGQILSSKPQERRALIEEAAGITRVKAKKQLTETKLDATRQNLARLQDILSEVERQVGTLKRQAAKARRYQRLQAQLTDYWRFILAAQYRENSTALDKLTLELTDLTATEQRLSQELAQQTTIADDQQTQLAQQEQLLTDLRQQLSEQAVALERTRSQIQAQQEQQRQAQERITEYQRELTSQQTRAQLINQELAHSRQQLSQVNNDLSHTEIGLRQAETRYNQQLTELQQAEQQLETFRSQLLATLSKAERLRHNKHQIEDSIKRTLLRQESLATEGQRAAERRRANDETYERLHQSLQQRTAQLATLMDNLAEVETQRREQQRTVSSNQKLLEDLTRQLARVQDRLVTLTQLDERRAYFSTAVQQLLGQPQIRQKFNLRGTLADCLNVRSEYEQLVEQVLGETLQTVLIATRQDLQAATAWLQQQGGQASFLVVDLLRAETTATLSSTALEMTASLPNQTTIAADVPPVYLLDILQIKALYRNLFVRAWPQWAQAIIAPTDAVAWEWANQALGRLIISPNGNQLYEGLWVKTAAAKEKATGILQLKRELKELAAQVTTLETQQIALTTELAAERQALTTLEAQHQEWDRQIRAEEKALAAQRVELQQAERERERARQHVHVVAQEEKDLQLEHQQQQTRLQPLIVELATIDAAQQQLEQQIMALSQQITVLKPTLETANQALADLRARNAANIERQRSVSSEVRRLETEQQRLQQRHSSAQFELTAWQQRAKDATEQQQDWQTRETAIQQSLAELQQLAQVTDQQLAQNRQSWQQRQQQLASLRESVAKTHHQRTQREVAAAGLHAELHYLAERCEIELNQELKLVVQTVDRLLTAIASPAAALNTTVVNNSLAANSSLVAELPTNASDTMATLATTANSDATGMSDATIAVDATDEENPVSHSSKLSSELAISGLKDLITTPLPLDATGQIDVATAQKALEAVRQKLAELGAVNLAALEELTVIETRQVFLQQQYQDIITAIGATETALREINRRSRLRFRQAFEQINANFKTTFQELFGGGIGEMRLLDEDDVLECGIEITAQPPGKRLQSLMLLSGGEKAMTAIALLIAIFRYRPSPFCVLDEVDAPLDEMNIGRFTAKLQQMSAQTQFLVITHSKRTMEAATALYGVTMQEAGVSRIVSVRFTTSESEAVTSGADGPTASVVMADDLTVSEIDPAINPAMPMSQ